MSAAQARSASIAVQQAPSNAWMERLKTVPGQLRLRQALNIVLALVVGLTGFHVCQRYAHLVQTIGQDAVPSIVAAENIRTTLADAHTQIVNVFLTGEDSAGANARAYRKSTALAAGYLLDAGQNISYGDDERRPILETMTQLSEYQRLIGMALAGKDQVDALLQADTLMRERILPAVVALDRANFAHLDQAYSEDRHSARYWLYGFLALAVLYALVLAETQWKLYATFRRVFNPALGLGFLVFAFSLMLFAAKAQTVLSDFRTAKEDAFDSIHALTQAQALAYSATAQESVYLLTHGRSEQALQAILFRDTAKRLFSLNFTDMKENAWPADLKSFKGRGLLGDELANITFDGEEQVAKATLKGWLDYMKIDAEIRALESAGRHVEAVALCLGTLPGQSDWAFQRFMKALKDTLNINHAQFDIAIEHTRKDLAWLWALLLPILLGPLIGSYIGLRQRLAEFHE